MEMADLLAINKTDGDNMNRANLAKIEYQNALHLMPTHKFGWTPKISTCSAIEGTGIESIWETINDYYKILNKDDNIHTLRRNQKEDGLNETLQSRLVEDFLVHPDVIKQLPILKQKVMDGLIIPYTASQKLTKLVIG